MSNLIKIFIVCVFLCACDSNTSSDKKQETKSNKADAEQELNTDKIMYYGKIGLKAALKINEELSGKWGIIKERTQQDKTFPLILAHQLVVYVAFDAVGRDIVLDFDRLEVVNRNGSALEPLSLEDIAQFQDLYQPIVSIINRSINTLNKE